MWAIEDIASMPCTKVLWYNNSIPAMYSVILLNKALSFLLYTKGQTCEWPQVMPKYFQHSYKFTSTAENLPIGSNIGFCWPCYVHTTFLLREMPVKCIRGNSVFSVSVFNSPFSLALVCTMHHSASPPYKSHAWLKFDTQSVWDQSHIRMPSRHVQKYFLLWQFGHKINLFGQKLLSNQNVKNLWIWKYF